ncbi:hypothetical protein MIMGU_mgv1a017148mg [Erythranthe guttata]|uniref:Uncharacterized protein n=1 Tax=Erythranthe guttata TaxID=4155 RepID=A0A022RS64_ERYGU|nr:hypothetical protein MIMGU_mgv1a017148mg [Erythranthe guttata]
MIGDELDFLSVEIPFQGDPLVTAEITVFHCEGEIGRGDREHVHMLMFLLRFDFRFQGCEDFFVEQLLFGVRTEIAGAAEDCVVDGCSGHGF